ncbi:xin actin-binding repeat-containing protein 1 [Anableps anableps]
MSALYMSKVANRESANSPSKVEKDQAPPRDSGKWAKLTKMNEDSQQRKDYFPPQLPEEHQTGLEDISEAHSEQLTSSQLSREMLFEQRQKSELRRLLKHTCPELKMLDDVVDEEFAEVLSSKMEPGSETGYEGEVLSRCLMFENRGRSNNTPKTSVAKGAVERWDYQKTSAVFEGLKDETCTKSFEGMIKSVKSPDLASDLNKEVEEEMAKIDVKVTRKVFENQSSSTYKPDEIQGNIPMVLNKEMIIEKTIKSSEISSPDSIQDNIKSRNKNTEEKILCVNTADVSTENDISCSEAFPRNDASLELGSTSYPDPERKSEIIKTNAALFQNNPFISTNIERENSYSHASKTQNQSSVAGEDYPTPNVKNRTHLFESMPFDKIKHQNQDEIETLVENIKETLNFLHHVKAIYSDGVIIEVNETMIAKKSQFTVSDRGPDIKYDKVAKGGAQNFIVQLLPRVNLKPQITYLKEDSKGFMEAIVVDALAHQHRFSENKDPELKTASVVQLVEDILNQDNSLRKGVIIQEDSRKCAEVIVYSLYKYFDEEDVKSYSPPTIAVHDEPEADIGSTLKNSQDQFWSGSIRANVKLFKSCIEKGDLEYLRSLHDDEPNIHKSELSPNQAALRKDDESYHQQISDPAEECFQVDVKRLKGMFSEGKCPSHDNCFKSSAVPSGESQSSIECSTGVSLLPQPKNSFNTCFSQELKDVMANPEGQNDNRVHHAEMAEAVDGTDEISDHNIANYSFYQDENEARTCGLFHEIHTEELFEIPIVSVTVNNKALSRAEAESSQEISNTQVESCLEKSNEPPLAQEIIVGPESNWQHKNTEAASEDANSKKLKTADTCSKTDGESTELVQKENIPTAMAPAQGSEVTPEQEGEDVCCQGTIQAALDSLEKSNINVTRGDFKAAMIYRHSHKSNQKTSQSDVQKHSTTDLCFSAEPKSNQEPKQEVTVANTEPPHPTEEPFHLQVTAANVEPPHPTKEPINLQVTVANMEPPNPSEPPLNIEVTLTDAEPPHPTTEPLNLEVTVSNPEPPPPTKEPLNLEVTVVNAESSHPTTEPLNLDVTVSNPEPPPPTKEPLNLEVTVANAEPPHPSKDLYRATQGVVSKKSKRVTGPKPPIPPKPEHLKEKQIVNQPSATGQQEGHKMSTVGTEEIVCQVPQPLTTALFLVQEDSTNKSVDHHGNYNLDKATKMLQQIEGKSEVQNLTVLLESNETDIKNINGQQQIKTMGKEEILQNTSGNDIISETDETHINFHEARQKFGGKVLSSKKTVPVKPKRVKHFQSSDKIQKHLSGEHITDGVVQIGTDPSSNNCEITADSAERHDKDTKQEIKVELREKKARMETDDERRQRLSVHMDEIVRGNVTAAMEIFEHLRKQEQLQSILSRVEEIENDTSTVDVTSLRRVFENVPDWVVNTDKKGEKRIRVENKGKPMQSPADIPKTKYSMEHVYGDLERASEEIINLKEQTLARLKDIEDTIKKALYSVSTLKSDSDIASLSNLFKESLGVVQESSHSGNVSKTDLSRTKPQKPQESSIPQRSTSTTSSPSTDTFSTKQQQSPPSSPAFISIQSAARKMDKAEAAPQETSICMKCQLNPKPDGKFRTTKTVTCNSPAQGKKVDLRKGGLKQTSHNQQTQELSVLQVQTDSEGNSIRGTTVENYERTDNSGNQSYISKASTLVAAQPEKITSQAVIQRFSSHFNQLLKRCAQPVRSQFIRWKKSQQTNTFFTKCASAAKNARKN